MLYDCEENEKRPLECQRPRSLGAFSPRKEVPSLRGGASPEAAEKDYSLLRYLSKNSWALVLPAPITNPVNTKSAH